MSRLLFASVLFGVSLLPGTEGQTEEHQLGDRPISASLLEASRAQPISYAPDGRPIPKRLPAPDEIVQAYKGSDVWEPTPASEVPDGEEFIWNGYLFRVTTRGGPLEWIHDVDIEKLDEADRPFDQNNERFPKADDVVRILSKPPKHELLARVKPGEKLVFQGREYEVFISGKYVKLRATGRVFQEVLANSVRTVNEMVKATIRFEATGQEHVIKGTKNHPFWLPELGRYERMASLQAGDRLLTEDGSLAEVVTTEVFSAPGTKVYNLEVGGANNFFVYASADTGNQNEQPPGVLVHNSAIRRGLTGARAGENLGKSVGAMRRLRFDPASYHGRVGNAVKSAGPKAGQTTLDTSFQLGSNSPRRIGVDFANREIVIFDQTTSGVFHGHVRQWGELTPRMQSVLRKWFDFGKRGQFPGQ